MSRLVELERLRGAHGAQTQRVAELDEARKVRRREWERARAQRSERVKAGEREGLPQDVDMDGQPIMLPEAELLRAELAEEARGLTPKLVQYMSQGGASATAIEMVDEDAEDKWQGATERLEAIEEELRRFAKRHEADIAIEKAPRAGEIAERAERVLRLAGEVMGEIQGERKFWADFLRLTVGEGEVPTVDMPPSPFDGLHPGVKVTPPLPERFLVGDAKGEGVVPEQIA